MANANTLYTYSYTTFQKKLLLNYESNSHHVKSLESIAVELSTVSENQQKFHQFNCSTTIIGPMPMHRCRTPYFIGLLHDKQQIQSQSRIIHWLRRYRAKIKHSVFVRLTNNFFSVLHHVDQLIENVL
jgi:hypothetical protein